MKANIINDISIQDIRELAVFKQGLNERPKIVGKNQLLDTIKNLGLIQLDSINIVQRSHYIVLFSRCGNYEVGLIDEMQYPDNEIMEQWAHVASLIPTEDIKYFLPELIARRNLPLSNRQLKVLGSEYSKTLQETLTAIEKFAPVSSNHLTKHNPNKHDWWSKSPSRVAFDVLFRRGHIYVVYRNKFKCFYGILNNEQFLDGYQNLQDFYRWVVLKSITVMGAASCDHISDYYRINKKFVQDAISILLKEEIIKEIKLPEFNNPLYVSLQNIQLIEKLRKGLVKFELTTLLSPFDNLIWNRERAEKIFNFFYRSEMYTPVDKRKFGYYVMPILHNGNLIGRLDPKFDRKNSTLLINNISLEKGVELSDRLIKCVADSIADFKDFIKARKVVIKNAETQEFAIKLNDLLS